MSDPAKMGADVASSLPAWAAWAARMAALTLASKLGFSGELTETLAGVVLGAATLAWSAYSTWKGRQAITQAIIAPAGQAKP